MTNSRGKNNCPSLIAIKSSRKPAVELFLVSELLLYAAVEGKDDTEPLKCQRVQRELLANCIKSSTSASPSWITETTGETNVWRCFILPRLFNHHHHVSSLDAGSEYQQTSKNSFALERISHPRRHAMTYRRKSPSNLREETKVRYWLERIPLQI